LTIVLLATGRGIPKKTVNMLMFHQGGSNELKPDSNKNERERCKYSRKPRIIRSNPSHPHTILHAFRVIVSANSPHRFCTERQVWDPWRIEGGNVTIFFIRDPLLRTFYTWQLFIFLIPSTCCFTYVSHTRDCLMFPFPCFMHCCAHVALRTALLHARCLTYTRCLAARTLPYTLHCCAHTALCTAFYLYTATTGTI
jgi:hypothetical protein